MQVSQRTLVVARVGITQTLAWASSYYLPAMLAIPMARDLGVSVPAVFAAFSAALIVSALFGPFAGRAIDRYGGRPILCASNVVFATGLLALSQAQGLVTLFAAWLLLGAGMGSGLYEAAFATLVRLYGQSARSAITGVTLFAGFASTVGWPLSIWMESMVGWRGACLTWAALHIVLALPINISLPKTATATKDLSPTADTTLNDVPQDVQPPKPAPAGAAKLLALVFAMTWFTSTAMAAHLPRLLESTGITLAAAVAISALVGPAQVGARLLEFGLLRRYHPLLSARLASLAHPVGATALLLIGGPAAVVFAILHGAGNGIMTIAMGTLPLMIFGSQGYGGKQGLLMVPARLLQALAPFLFGLLIDRWGSNALWVSGVTGIVSFTALWWLARAQRMTPQR
jgi:predicted MFS family arabinose efflux permease